MSTKNSHTFGNRSARELGTAFPTMATSRTIHGYFSLLLSVLLSKSTTIQFSQATSTLFPNQTIHDGQSLISANKTFELGFFSPAGSTNRYVGIWYHNLPEHQQTVVWVANRERPILDSSGFLTIDYEGNLILLDSIGSAISIASNTGQSNATSATLLDSGNLVLSDSHGILWQSFDNPTDTFLPGMMLGLDGKQNRLVTSWMSPQDPSPGEFSLGIDPNGTKQFFIWKRGQIYWASGVWNGHHFSQISEQASSYYAHKLGYVGYWSGGCYSYSFKDKSTLSREVMDVSGQLKRLTWLEDEWVLFLVQSASFSCETPDYCGANGLCNNNTSPVCSCMSGFIPNLEEQWKVGEWSGGCVRELQPKCEYDNEFLRLSNVKLPLFFSDTSNFGLSLVECEAMCLRNCSCTAYALAHGNGTGCLRWFSGLIGLQKSFDGGQDLYVRVATSDNNNHGRKRVLLIVIPIVAAVILLVCALICYFRRRKHTENEEGQTVADCPMFSFATIAAATSNFSTSNKLGEGGFGPVYKGLLDGHAIAVKRLSKSSGQGLEECKNEINLISNLQHRNLVRLLGCCIKKEEKILIYEYMPNKSLDFYIFDPIKGAQLDWSKRFHIIEGIAQGLLYLHKYSRLRIIHRDLKSSNILLDDEMNPKISDFGMARIFGRNENQANTRRVVGTYGYMSPEYAMDGLFSVKSDVFSFGVLLLEIVSGKKNTAFRHSESFVNLLGYAWQLWKENRGLELMDSSLGKNDSSPQVLRCLHVALLCVQERAADRPTMSDVVSMLSSESSLLPIPKQPAFSLVSSQLTEDLPLSGHGTAAQNDVTITIIDGR